MREYVVTIETQHHPITLTLFAKDRNDAISFTKRVHRAKFWAKEYKKVKGARAKGRESAVQHEAQ